MHKTILLALGGNAILQPKQAGTYENQLANVSTSAKMIAKLVARGYRVVLTHGNGPQVGNILRQNEEAANVVPPLPLDVLNGKSQGFIGYMMQQCLTNELQKLGIDKKVVSLISRVKVDPNDSAFTDPSKPIGMFYDEKTAQELINSKGWKLKADAGRGWRRVVPSPRPVKIVERDSITTLVDSGFIVIACGGGGIPVVEKGTDYEGIEAVIDKDLSGSKMAQEIDADVFLIVTDVEHVFINYGKPEQQALHKVALDEMKAHQTEGQFSKGSMGPKVEAAMQFTELTGKTSIICSLDKIDVALEGKSGTWITAEPLLMQAANF